MKFFKCLIAIAIFIGLNFNVLYAKENKSEVKSLSPWRYIVWDYKNNYLIGGGREDGAKAQFSFKYDIFNPYDFYNFNFFFAYTQRTFWNPYIKPLYFTDINFNPELFLEKTFKEQNFKLLRFGYEHLSNNQDEEESRAWDRAFIEGEIGSVVRGFYLGFDTRIFYMVNKGSKTQDIQKFIGFHESKLFIKEKDKIYGKEQLYFKWANGNSLFKKGWYEIGVVLKTTFFKFNPHLFFAFRRGYANCLLNYNVKETSFKAGFLLF